MNPIRPNSYDDLFDQLLAYRLGECAEGEKQRIEALLASNDEARQVDQDVQATLSPLADYDVSVPSDLKDKIIASCRIPRLSIDTVLNDLAPDVTVRRRTVFSRFVDFAATAAAVVLISSAVLLSSGYARQQSRKAFCAANLGILGSAITSYANDYHNQLPYAKLPSSAAWYDSQSKHPRRVHLFVLVKKGYVKPLYLVCPEDSVNFKPLPDQDLSKLNDFPKESLVSYSFQNLFGDQQFSPKLRQLRWAQAQQLAIMADRTPLMAKDQLHSTIDSETAYSPNHAGLRGQNILSLDGKVTWQKTPFFGPRQDNIWQAGTIRQYVGKEIPTDPTDSFLAP